MKVQRFVATDMRTALRDVRAELGAEAVPVFEQNGQHSVSSAEASVLQETTGVVPLRGPL